MGIYTYNYHEYKGGIIMRDERQMCFATPMPYIDPTQSMFTMTPMQPTFTQPMPQMPYQPEPSFQGQPQFQETSSFPEENMMFEQMNARLTNLERDVRQLQTQVNVLERRVNTMIPTTPNQFQTPIM